MYLMIGSDVALTGIFSGERACMWSFSSGLLEPDITWALRWLCRIKAHKPSALAVSYHNLQNLSWPSVEDSKVALEKAKRG